MADKKISALTPSTTPLTGAEVLPIVQSGSTVKVSVADLTAGRAVAATSVTTGLGAVGTPAYTFAGDTNTGIYSPTADTIAFVEGGVEAVRINSSGNVGIGTTAPSVRLDVTGPVETTFSPNVYNTALFGTSSATSGNAGSGISFKGYTTGSSTVSDLAFISGIKENATDGNYAGTLVFGTRTNASGGGSFERMRINSSGNVGIGNSSAAPKFSVTLTTGFTWGGGWGTGVAVFGGNGAGSGAGSGGLGISYDDTDGASIGPIIPGVAWKPLRLFSENIQFCTSGTTERARIDSSGNVGIGTSAPGAKLDTKGLVRSSIGTGTGAGGAGYAFYQFGSSATNSENWHIGSEGDGSFRFYNQGFGAGLERMRISSAGDVAIGTSSPSASALLDVQSTTKGFRLPNMTTTQKNAISSPAAGLMVFDTTLAKACVYSGSAWQTITSI